MVYAIQVWGSACASEINKIQVYTVLQKRVLRIITYKDTLPSVPGPLHHTDPLFLKLEILKVYDVFKLQPSKFIFNCLHLYTPINFHDWFTLNHTIHNYNTIPNFFDIDKDINSSNLFVINAKTTHYVLKLLKVSGPKIWNSIPKHIRKKQSIFTFLQILSQKTSDSSIYMYLINVAILFVLLLLLCCIF